jgi:hypothetical protein
MMPLLGLASAGVLASPGDDSSTFAALLRGPDGQISPLAAAIASQSGGKPLVPLSSPSFHSNSREGEPWSHLWIG